MNTTRRSAIIRDASVAGVWCEITQGPVPDVGECLLLQWPDTSGSFADVVWSEDRSIGLQPCYSCVDLHDGMTANQLGPEYDRRLRLSNSEDVDGPTQA